MRSRQWNKSPGTVNLSRGFAFSEGCFTAEYLAQSAESPPGLSPIRYLLFMYPQVHTGSQFPLRGFRLDVLCPTAKLARTAASAAW